MLPSRPMRPHSASHACLVRRFSLVWVRVQLAYERERNGGERDAHATPERMHSVERLALAVLHRARCNVLNCRLVGADEY